MLRGAWRNGVGGGRKESWGNEELVGEFARCHGFEPHWGRFFFSFFFSFK
jgi:hypothetical protein